MRRNTGGNSGLLDLFLIELKKRKELLPPGSVIVLIGKNTFSSAIINAIELKSSIGPVYIGGPTGGKPNHFGEILSEKLSYSNTVIKYSIKYLKLVKDDPSSLIPDILVGLNFKDYSNGTDSILIKA